MQGNEQEWDQRRKYPDQDSGYGSFIPSQHRRLREQSQEQHVNHIAGKNIGIETHSQGKQTCQRTDNLNRQYQPGDPPLGSRREMLSVVQSAVVADSLPVEVEEGDSSTRQGYGNVSRRSRKQREQAKQVGKKNEDADGPHDV